MGGGGDRHDYSFGGRSSGSDEPNCASLKFTTILSVLPDEPHAPAGALLDIAFYADEAGPVIGATDSDDLLIGTVQDRVTDLAPCLSSGFEYRAEVLEHVGPAHRVRIEPKSDT